ncbi:hypothetical protein ABZ086_32525, partial [Streptomyces halstedii]
MTLSVTFSLVTGIVWASSDSPDDPSVTAARGGDAAGSPPWVRPYAWPAGRPRRSSWNGASPGTTRAS